jgi:hypothetical protein
MLIVIVIFFLTLKLIFKKPFEKTFWRGKKKSEIVVRLSFFFFGSCEFIYLFLAQGQSWMIFFWCALFTYDGPTYLTNAFFVVSVTDSGSTQQDVAGVLAH